MGHRGTCKLLGQSRWEGRLREAVLAAMEEPAAGQAPLPSAGYSCCSVRTYWQAEDLLLPCTPAGLANYTFERCRHIASKQERVGALLLSTLQCLLPPLDSASLLAS